jgi:hypothetical protein
MRPGVSGGAKSAAPRRGRSAVLYILLSIAVIAAVAAVVSLAPLKVHLLGGIFDGAGSPGKNATVITLQALPTTGTALSDGAGAGPLGAGLTGIHRGRKVWDVLWF